MTQSAGNGTPAVGAEAAAGVTVAAAAQAQASLRLTQPLTCLLLWAASLDSELPAKTAKATGLEPLDVEQLSETHREAADEMLRLRLVGRLFNRKQLGLLLRARLAEQLMKADTARELQQLSRAAATLPWWAFGDQPFPRPPARQRSTFEEGRAISRDGGQSPGGAGQVYSGGGGQAYSGGQSPTGAGQLYTGDARRAWDLANSDGELDGLDLEAQIAEAQRMLNIIDGVDGADAGGTDASGTRAAGTNTGGTQPGNAKPAGASAPRKAPIPRRHGRYKR